MERDSIHRRQIVKCDAIESGTRNHGLAVASYRWRTIPNSLPRSELTEMVEGNGNDLSVT